MKRLIVCCDGTWNVPEQEDYGKPSPTNVVRLYNCLAEEGNGTKQRHYYHSGVGTEGNMLARSAGGAYGKGLGQNVQSAYRWLGSYYEPSDEIFLFGFSRGAFTVRSLAGMIGACKLLDLRNVESGACWHRVQAAYERCYRVPPAERTDEWLGKGWAVNDVPIRFLGVWDTVGSLGIPDDMAILNLLDRPQDWRFHDESLGKHVQTARHAVALDEMRASFAPTVWKDVEQRDDVKQIWFPGVHSDVGGGYADTGLADGTLRWMIDEAAKAGLAFNEAMTAQVRPDSGGTLHDSVRGVFKGLRTRPRAIPALVKANPSLHGSVWQRHTTPPIAQAPYRLHTQLQMGESTEVTVYARERWNNLGIYLEPGEYEFKAAGEWLDASIPCGPAGTRDGHFHPGEIVHMAGSTWGLVERAWQAVTGNEGADFWMTRRVESAPWFALMGVIANDSGGVGPNNDGSPSPHEMFVIGTGCRRKVSSGGYLFAFANDAWSKYDNNRGGVKLNVTRIS
jgi:hypothetical protein